MRDAFIDELTMLARHDSRITILSADVGNRTFAKFAQDNPGRFVNTGIAEANMIGMAAGMAMAGLRPFAYSIASFSPGRCAEQIRLDLCQHNLPVVVTGVGAGLSYAALGPTHHALEDVAWMRALPNMRIVCPGDPVEVRLALRAIVKEDGPFYLRLGKKGDPVLHDGAPDFRIGKVLQLREGNAAALLAVGTALPLAMDAAALLAKDGLDAAVYSMHTVKPLDEDFLSGIFEKTRAVAVIEEHVRAGGAWSAVAEWVTERGGTHVPLLRFGTPDAFFHEAGGQDWTRRRFGLDPQAMANRLRLAIEKSSA